MSTAAYYIGIDNGQSGSVGIIGPDGVAYESIPTQDYLHYGKKGTISQRLDRAGLSNLLPHFSAPGPWVGYANIHIYIERPFSGKFINAVVPAHRFFEATIICLEDLQLGYTVVDSREWQAKMLGNVKGSANLKKASLLRGLQLYPQLAASIKSQGDADGLLIAHYFANRSC